MGEMRSGICMSYNKKELDSDSEKQLRWIWHGFQWGWPSTVTWQTFYQIADILALNINNSKYEFVSPLAEKAFNIIKMNDLIWLHFSRNLCGVENVF